MIAPTEILQQIQDHLGHDDVLTVIEQFAPRTLTEAITWARCRPFWDEHRGQYSDQAIGIAAVVSQRAMKEYRLTFGQDGKLVQHKERKEWRTPKPSLIFPLEVQEHTIRVEYTHGYFPVGSQGYFYFTNAAEPGKPHPLSGSGYLSHFCQNSSVEACGGPHAYARLFAQAVAEGREKEFVEAFEGKSPGAVKQRRQRPEPAEEPEIFGEHTAAVIEEPRKPQQGMLF